MIRDDESNGFLKSLLSRIEEEQINTGNGGTSAVMKTKEDFSTFSEENVNLIDYGNQGNNRKQNNLFRMRMQGGE